MKNLEFVQNALDIMNSKYGYIWGAKGQLATEALLKSCIAEAKRSGRYTFTEDKIRYIRENYIKKNRKVVDCSGLLTLASKNSVLGSATIWEQCTEKSSNFSQIPNIKGLIVYRRGHIGIYIGDNKVLESGGTKVGVVITDLNNPATGNAWTHYGKWSKIDYEVVVKEEVTYKVIIVPSTGLWRRREPYYAPNTIDQLVNEQLFIATGITENGWLQIGSGGWIEAQYCTAVTEGELPIVDMPVQTIFENQPATFKLTRILKKGMSGEDVKYIQTRLGVKADGVFGKNTQNAVYNFQGNHGLNKDGIVGPKTCSIMGIEWAT